MEIPQDSVGAAIRKYYGTSLLQLISLQTIQKLEELARYIPQVITPMWGYELPLYTSEKTSDFLVCMNKPDVFTQAFCSPAQLEAIIDEPIYSRLRELAHRWANRNDSVGRFINNVWLEYDYKRLLTNKPCPSFFYGPKNTTNPLAIVWASQQVLESLSPNSLPRGTFRFLLNCVLQLEKKGQITQIGQMLARNESSLRLFIQRLPKYGILPYLRKIVYPHVENQALVSQLDRCCQLADTVDLDIDITDRVGRSVGLECYFDTAEKALIFLADLAERGLCVPEKYEPLRTCVAQLRSSKVTDDLTFMFSHIKLVYHPGTGFLAKVYLGYVASEHASTVVRTQPISTI